MANEKSAQLPAPIPTDKMSRLPPALLAELDLRIARRNFTDFRDLKSWLRQRGYSINTNRVARYASKLDFGLEAVRMASAQAAAIVEACGEDDMEMNQALLRLVQQHLFAVLVELKGVELSRANVPALARSVAGLVRVSIEQRRYLEEMRAGLAIKVAEATATVDTAAAGGLSEDAAAQIKRALMEITE